MRPLVDNFCALAGVFFLSVAACAFASQSASGARADEARSGTRVAVHAVKCLGGVLNQDPAANYLAAGDYPEQAAAPAGGHGVVICGDRIPPFIPSGPWPARPLK
jgi:hypothetical protein